MTFPPSKDKAAFNLLPDEAVKFSWHDTHKYQYTSTESHSSQK